MKYCIVILMIVIILSTAFTGCTKPSGTGPVTIPATSVPLEEPAAPVPPETTGTPQQVVTIIHQVSLTKDIKDTELLFTLQVPVEWNVVTYRLNNADNSEGLVYQTDLVGDNAFYIHTYAASRSQDQAYRDQFRKWSPAPAETTVILNDITYDRFESLSEGKVHVAYVARKSSANERGYASVLVFEADTGNRFETEDYETVVSSFRYFPGSFAGSMPGEEIARISLPDLSGSARSRSGSSGAVSGGSSSGCSACGG